MKSQLLRAKLYSNFFPRYKNLVYRVPTATITGPSTLLERCWRCDSYRRTKSVQCLTAFSAKLPTPCSPSLTTCPVTGSTATPGALQIGSCLRKQWGWIMTSRGGTMASTAEPPDVDSCPCTSLFSYCTKKLNLCPADPPCFRQETQKNPKMQVPWPTDLWDEYEANVWSAKRLLKACSYVNAPRE